jgi:protein subunit release factor B
VNPRRQIERHPIFSVTIRDCEIQTFRSGGKGGQNQNKTESGVRIIHHPSGARGESREFRSQLENKRAAFRRMGTSADFQKWARSMAARLRGEKTLEDRVEEAMAPENLLIETQTADGWIVEK